MTALPCSISAYSPFASEINAVSKLFCTVCSSLSRLLEANCSALINPASVAILINASFLALFCLRISASCCAFLALFCLRISASCCAFSTRLPSFYISESII